MKKIKNNSKGFVLAETLVVTVFLMAIFGLIYTSFYPLIGEYEKRETYDDVDGKYAAYWVKRLIEDSSYQINPTSETGNFFNTYKFVRFECSDMQEDGKRQTCINLVNSLEIDGCDKIGNNCEIYITKYQIGSADKAFKNTIKEHANATKGQINCMDTKSRCTNKTSKYVTKCIKGMSGDNSTKESKCKALAVVKAFRDDFKDYINTLPEYTAASLNGANYRVIISFHHTKDNNNYYSYATIEVNK